MEWAMVLVIILSITLAIFLILAIVLIVQLIKVTKEIKMITSSAQRTVTDVEDKVHTVMAMATPLAAAKYAQSFVKNFKNNKGGKK